MTPQPWYRKMWAQIVLGLVLGILYGVLSAALGWTQFTEDYIAPFGTVFVNGLQLIAVPLVLASLIVGVASLSDMRKVSRIGGKTLAIYVATTAMSVTIGLTYANLVRPGDRVPPSLRAELGEQYRDAAAGREGAANAMMEERGPLGILEDIIPPNVVSSASSNRNMLQVVFVALLFGIALIRIPKETAGPLLGFFKGLEAVVVEFVGIVMRIAPLGVFALISRAISGMAGDDPGEVVALLGALGFYCLVVVVGLATQMFVVYPLILKFFTPIGWKRVLTAAAPVQLVAFSTSSSGATLPVTMRRARQMGVSEEVSSFVLPLGATVNMDGTALYQAAAALFIAQALGIPVGLEGQLAIVLTAVLASIGTAAVPGAGIIMLVIILQAIGVPAEGVALILGVDRLLDMLRTATNVTGDLTVATVVAASEEGQLDLENAEV